MFFGLQDEAHKSFRTRNERRGDDEQLISLAVGEEMGHLNGKYGDQTIKLSMMPGKGIEEGKLACAAVFPLRVLMALLFPSPSSPACPLPPVTRCGSHKATILEHAGIKWK
ncbi:hypothetical protein E1301_Tti006836 [Triplophysa tibetana]|uniref:Uncharacterized protein n=1 Tax=Triplophysa tibetana TaxID=1572043 RepID=A0A5A9N4A5_9TELE|nr:hypothetical protein E1301_Tti006836 [Triplophysa tibetana]